jgi:3-phenylpropionate/trans-cinnamate dioxygenase ferredoxin reductase subunit
MGSSRLLFIGNGGAAVNAIQAARAAGYTDGIDLVSDTPGQAFNPMLSPYYLSGQIFFEDCFPFGQGFYKKQNVTCHFGAPAEALDPLSKDLCIRGGKRLIYDRCLIATGSSPVLPPVPGLKDSRYVYTLRTAEETICLKQAIPKAKNALILGASLVGVKLAEILVKQGLKVTLVDIADQVLPHAANPECASLVNERIKNEGVDLRLSQALTGVEDGQKGAHFHFQGNETVTADLCLVSTGVKANLDFLQNSGVQIDQGILVDDTMCTSAEDLYAAGDVSQGTNLLSGKKELIGLWGNACYQGRTAGFNMAGVKASHPGGMPDHVNSFFGLTFVHLGDVNRQGDDITVLSNHDLSEGWYRLMVFDKNVLVGANLINGFQNAGKLRTAILRKIDWSKYLDRSLKIPTDQEINEILAAVQI